MAGWNCIIILVSWLHSPLNHPHPREQMRRQYCTLLTAFRLLPPSLSFLQTQRFRPWLCYMDCKIFVFRKHSLIWELITALKVFRQLRAKYWVGTHDAVKKGAGIVSWFLRRKGITLAEAVEGEMEKRRGWRRLGL